MKKHVWQCKDARRSEDHALASIPSHQRICAKVSYWQSESRRTDVEGIGYTMLRGDCPVCTALQETLGPNWIDKWKDERYTELAGEVVVKVSKPTIIRVSILDI